MRVIQVLFTTLLVVIVIGFIPYMLHDICFAETSNVAVNYETKEIFTPNEEPVGDEKYKELIAEYAEIYELPKDLCIAVARLETGNFENIERHWNFGGLSVNEKPLSYANETSGINAYMKCLSNLWHGDLDRFCETYCPKNPRYKKLLVELMEEEKC